MSFFSLPYILKGLCGGSSLLCTFPMNIFYSFLLYLYVYNHVIQMYFIAVGDKQLFNCNCVFRLVREQT